MKVKFFVSPHVAEELAAKWFDEHESYYGQPHGASGCVSMEEDTARFFGVPLHLTEYARLGLNMLPGNFVAWRTSGGNWAAINPLTGDVRIASRRHGIPIHTISCLKGHEIGEIYIDSFRPDLAWWETSKG